MGELEWKGWSCTVMKNYIGQVVCKILIYRQTRYLVTFVERLLLYFDIEIFYFRMSISRNTSTTGSTGTNDDSTLSSSVGKLYTCTQGY